MENLTSYDLCLNDVLPNRDCIDRISGNCKLNMPRSLLSETHVAAHNNVINCISNLLFEERNFCQIEILEK